MASGPVPRSGRGFGRAVPARFFPAWNSGSMQISYALPGSVAMSLQEQSRTATGLGSVDARGWTQAIKKHCRNKEDMFVFQVSNPGGAGGTQTTIINYKTEPNAFATGGIEKIYAVVVPGGSEQAKKLDGADKKVETEKENVKATFESALDKELDSMKKQEVRDVYTKVQMKNWKEYHEAEIAVDQDKDMTEKEKVKAHNELTEDYQAHREENILNSPEYTEAEEKVGPKYEKIKTDVMVKFNTYFDKYCESVDNLIDHNVKMASGDEGERTAAGMTAGNAISNLELMKVKLESTNMVKNGSKVVNLGIQLDDSFAKLTAASDEKTNLLNGFVKDNALAHLIVENDGISKISAGSITKVYSPTGGDLVQQNKNFSSATSVLSMNGTKAQFTQSENPALFSIASNVPAPVIITPPKTPATTIH